MKVKINNDELEIANSLTVNSYIDSLQIQSSGLAIAINNVLLPRPKWANTLFQENDNVIIIQAAYGG